MATAPPNDDIPEVDDVCIKPRENWSVKSIEKDINSYGCTCFRRLSQHIASIDKVGDLCQVGNAPCANALTILEKIPVDIRSSVAKYLSSGKESHLNLSMANFHYIYHMASILHLQQLRRVCINFCSASGDCDIGSLLEDCPLRDDLILESQLYQRSMSLTPDSGVKIPPEFFVVFSRNSKDTKKGGKEITNVIVISISEKMDVYNRETGQLGKATDCCTAYVDESPYIFVCGGEDKSHDLVWKYDVLLSQWNKCARLLHGRSRHNVVADQDGSVFVLGGREVACIEQYTISSNRWKETAALKTHVYNAVATYYKGNIYVFGGQTASGSVATVQCYDTTLHKVTKLEDLPCSFSGGQAAVFGDKIFIATSGRHMICFEPTSGNSYLCSQQPIEREHFGMFVKEDRVFVVGGVPRTGVKEEEPRDTHMYRYNPLADRWSQERNLQKMFPVYSSCVIKYPKPCSVIPFRDRN